MSRDNLKKEIKAEKSLLTTLSSCCNSMRGGMQQKERNGEGGVKRAEEIEKQRVALAGPGGAVTHSSCTGLDGVA